MPEDCVITDGNTEAAQQSLGRTPTRAVSQQPNDFAHSGGAARPKIHGIRHNTNKGSSLTLWIHALELVTVSLIVTGHP